MVSSMMVWSTMMMMSAMVVVSSVVMVPSMMMLSYSTSMVTTSTSSMTMCSTPHGGQASVVLVCERGVLSVSNFCQSPTTNSARTHTLQGVLFPTRH